MKFLSIKEYFYKLNTIGFILLLMPMVLFIFLYFYQIDHRPMLHDINHVLLVGKSMLAVLMTVLTIVHWAWVVKVRRLRKVVELANKMDGYFLLALTKMSFYCGASFLMALGFYLTGHSGFTAVFILLLLGTAFQWPTPAAFSRQMRLGHIERDIIMNNRDLYQKNRKA